VGKLADYIRKHAPEIRGFTRRGLYRMRQFYETYEGNEKVSALLTQLSWTHHGLSIRFGDNCMVLSHLNCVTVSKQRIGNKNENKQIRIK